MIIGHKKQWELLKKIPQGKRIPQALIFSGSNFIGKKKIALQFIKLMNCKNNDNPCEVCFNCKSIEKQNHPDLIIVPKESKEIKIDAIRNLQLQLRTKPQFFSGKVIVIDNADALNSSAQNCLLKILEEPPENAIFILITSLPQVLFKTILSRCEILKFYPVSVEELLSGFNSKEANPHFKDIIASCAGKPGIAVKYFENTNAFIDRNKQINLVGKLIKDSLPERFAFSKSFFTKDTTQKQVTNLLDNFIEYLRKLLLTKLGISKNQNYKEVIDKYSIQQIKELLYSFCDLNYLFASTNIDKRLAFENLMLNL